jgi:hypothetical protein
MRKYENLNFEKEKRTLLFVAALVVCKSVRAMHFDDKHIPPAKKK